MLHLALGRPRSSLRLFPLLKNERLAPEGPECYFLSSHCLILGSIDMMSGVPDFFLIVCDLGMPGSRPLHLWASVSAFIKCGD